MAYGVTKGFVISSASQAIFSLIGNISLVLAVVLAAIALVRIRVLYLHVLIVVLLLIQALYVFLIGYINYEYFVTRYALFLIQMIIVMIAVFSKNFSISVFASTVAGTYLLSALVMMGTGASLDQAANTGSLVQTETDTLNNYQGLAHVFGVCATIFTVIAFASGRKGWVRIFLVGPALGFLMLTFYSGGRGELIAAVFVMLIIVSRSHVLAKLIILVAVTSILTYSDALYELQQSAGYKRILYTIEHDDTGMRAQLFLEALQAYGDGNIFQIFFGQGLNAFQDIYGYDWGFYPHNFLIEMLLTSGIILFVFYFVLYLNIAVGLFSEVSKVSVWNSLFFGIGCHYLILTMKSGTISTSSAAIAFLFVAWFCPEMRAFKVRPPALTYRLS